MARVFSWKLGDNLYGYLVKVNNGSYLTSTRIESTEVLRSITEEVKNLTVESAKTCFNSMAQEANDKYGISIVWKDDYWDSTINSNYIVLTGGDGNGGTGSGGSYIDPVFEEFAAYIDACLKEAEDRIAKSNEEVKKYLEEATRKDIEDARADLEKAKKDLEKIEKEAVESLSAATSALDGARSLFSGGTITPESIKDVMDKTKVVSDWMSGNSESLSGMTFDYNEATKILAGGYTATTTGAFSKLAVGINAVSGTVGSVREDMNAVEGRVSTLGEYVNTLSGTVDTVKREMSGIDSRIKDMVTHADLKAEVTTEVSREMSGAEARITDKVIAQTSSGITEVSRDVNALSGFIRDKVIVELSGNVTTIRHELNGVSGTALQAITKADAAMASAITLRDEWNVASGMVRAVADMVASADSKGIIYLYRAGEKEAETDKRVWRNPNDGKYYVDEAFKTVVADQSRVYTKYCEKMGSYISQTSSSITLSVVDNTLNDEEKMGPSINMCIEQNGKGTMSLIANKITLGADVIIGGGLSAKTANIGDIVIGSGMIYSTKSIGGSPSFMLNGTTGGFTAQSADIKGKVTANSGAIGGITIESNSIHSSNNNFSVDSSGNLKALSATLAGSITATGGSVGGITIENNSIHSSNSNFSVDSNGILIAKNAQINGGITAATGTKTSVMDANRFEIKNSNDSISIEILSEWSGRTNVPALVMTFGGERYVLSPGSWMKEGGGGTYAAVVEYKYNTAYTGTSLDDIKTRINSNYGKVAKTTVDPTYCKVLKETGTLWKIEATGSGTIPSSLNPFINKYVTVYPGVTYIDDSNVDSVVSTITGKLANIHFLKCTTTDTTNMNWFAKTFCNNGSNFILENVGGPTYLTTTCSRVSSAITINGGVMSLNYTYCWGKGSITGDEPSGGKRGDYYTSRTYETSETPMEGYFLFVDDCWGYGNNY